MKCAHLLAWLIACQPLLADAHKPSDSYLSLRVEGAAVQGQWDIALRDLEYAIGLDTNGDGAITWGELRRRHADITAYALSRLDVEIDGAPCRLQPSAHLVDEHSDGAYAVLRFSASCAVQSPRAITVRYRLFFDLDPTHRGLINVTHDGGSVAGVLGPDRAAQEFSLVRGARFGPFLAYAREGTWHIWIGADHLLFLLSLLLPAVLMAAPRGWEPSRQFAPVFWDVFKVVTAFTAAHSITLSLAALSVIELPSRWVESLIALSVLLAALNNLRPVIHGRRWIVAFAFGLVHGFGFASVLADLGLPSESLLIALVAFNVGVEAGQLVVVSAFLPIAFALRATAFYRRIIFAGGSAAIAAVAVVWMVERAFDLQLMPG